MTFSASGISPPLLGKSVQENDDIDRPGGKRDPVPAQEQIRLRARMRSQHRRIAEIRLARRNAAAGQRDGEILHERLPGRSIDLRACGV